MPWTLLMRPTVILGLLLALSVAGNVALYKLHSYDLQQIGSLKAQRADALADATACSEGVKKLLAATAKRERVLALVLKSAEDRAKKAEERADAILQERPAAPGDACGSALELNQRKLKERHHP